MGLRGQRVPRLLRRALGPQRRALPPGDRRRDRRAGGALRGLVEPLLLRARDAALRAAGRVEPRRQGVPRQHRHRGERVRDQAGPQARPRSRDRARPRSSSSPTPSTAARWRPWPRRRSSRATTCSGRFRDGFVSVPRDDPEALRAAVGAKHRRGDDRADPGRGGDLPDRRRGARRRPRGAATRPARCWSSTRSRPGWGRTGTLWAYEQLEVRPDVLTSAKALGGGLPGRRRRHHARARRRARARRPRLDLRRRPDRRLGGARGAGR